MCLFFSGFAFIIIATRHSISQMKHLLFELFVQLTIIHAKMLCANVFHTNPFPPSSHIHHPLESIGAIFQCDAKKCRKQNTYVRLIVSVFVPVNSLALFHQLNGSDVLCVTFCFYQGKQHYDLKTWRTVSQDWHISKEGLTCSHHWLVAAL